MELPFKYIVLCIIRTLNERNMSLVIDRITLVNYLTEFMNMSFFTIEEKKEIGDNFDFNYEIDDLLSKYFQYFDKDGEKIIFDSDYVDEIDNLILEEADCCDEMIICDVDDVIKGDTLFLDILGVKINKELYNYLLDIERDIEDCYDEMCRLESYVGIEDVDLCPLISKMKLLKMKKTVMLLNTSNLLSYFERCDLMHYACNISDKTSELGDIEFLLDDALFSEISIMDDSCLRSIFTGSDLYISNLGESININTLGMDNDVKYSMVKFYLTFLDLLDREIQQSNELLNVELIRIKYRLMNVLDSVYDTALFVNRQVIYDDEVKENYEFADRAVCYFINELLMYDDEKYRNRELDVENTMVYLNNIMKKLLIETYYILTKDRKIIDMIKENKLYGVNAISSSFLENIVDKLKIKKRGV